jgi:hypothetical protein
MEQRGTRPSGIVRGGDLVTLTRLRGPVLSLYMNTDPDIDNAARRDEQRWRSTRRGLADQGVPESVLAEVDPLVGPAHLGGRCLAVIADGDGVQWIEHGNCPVPLDKQVWGPLPHLVPLLSWRQEQIPYVLVVTDRTGADITGFAPGHEELHEQVTGSTDPIRKVAPGGWSQRRYQQRAENTWEQNADDVAHTVVELVHRTDARLLLIGGDVRATALLRDALPGDVRATVVEVAATRAADGSDGSTSASVARALETIVGHDTTEVLQKYAEELGQNDRATEGVDETIGALQRAQVDALLLMESELPDRTAWYGPDPAQLATKVNALETFAVDEPIEAPLVDVLVRAALGTDAGVRIVANSSLLAEGVGALLRWR